MRTEIFREISNFLSCKVCISKSCFTLKGKWSVGNKKKAHIVAIIVQTDIIGDENS